jgi:DNA-binding FrmR family transcriptional regulator
MLLKPLYDQVVDKNLLNRLAQIQGQIGTVKKTIADKSYACRTDVLDDFRVEEITGEGKTT